MVPSDRSNIKNLYFDWLIDTIADSYQKQMWMSQGDISFYKLIVHLYSVPFSPLFPLDQNRAEDGIELRWRFASEIETERDKKLYIKSMLSGPCTMLEMMIALALRMEQTFMFDPAAGNRTNQYFFEMINSLQLGCQYNSNYNQEYVDDVLNRFMKNEYSYNGEGGLFFVRHPKEDMSTIEIWKQMSEYINEMSGY